MIRLLLAVFLLAAFNLPSAHAGPADFSKARRSAELIKKLERELLVSAKKLTPIERGRLKRITRGSDSDGDGLPDVLEAPFGANRCDADSDDDGLDDGEDTDEDNSGDNGDGVDDGETVETKGVIQSFTDPVLVVGTTRLELAPGTVFFRGLNSKADLVPGICIEAECTRAGTTLVVNKIKRHRGPACGENDD